MATELGQAYVQIVPSARGISGSIQKALDPEASVAGVSAGGKISLGMKAAVVAGAAAIGAAVVKITKSAIAEGAKLEQSLGGAETIYKEAFGSIKKYASEAYRTAGISANEYLDQATKFGEAIKKGVGGDVVRAAELANTALTDMSDNANKYGTDIERLKDAYMGFSRGNYTMLDNLNLGFAGTKTGMQELLTKAEELSGRKFELGNMADMIEAIRVVQTEVGITGTTAKEASETLSGSLASMKAAYADVLGYLSTGNDMLEGSIKHLAESASVFLFGNLIPMIGRVLIALPGALVEFIQTSIPLIAKAGGQLMDSLQKGVTDNLPKAIDAIGTKLTAFIQTIPQKIKDGVENAGDIATVMLDLAYKIITALATGFVTHAPAIVTGLGDAIGTAIESVNSGSQPFLVKLGDTVLKLLDGLDKGFIEHGPAMAQSIMDSLKNIILTALGVLNEDEGNPGKQGGKSFIEKFIEGVNENQEGIYQALKEIGQIILSTLGEIIMAVVEQQIQNFTNYLQGIEDMLVLKFGGIKGVLVGAWDAIKTDASLKWQEITDSITGKVDILKVLTTGKLESAKTLISGIFNGIKQDASIKWQEITGTIVGIVVGLVTSVVGKWNELKGNVIGIANGTKDGAIRAWNTLVGSVQGIVESVKAKFNGLRNINLYEIGKAIIDGFLRGLRRKYAEVQSFIGGIGTWIQNNKGPIEYDRKLLIPAGIAIMEGLNKGLRDKFKAVKSTVSVMAEEIANSFNSPVAFAGFEGIDVDADFDPVYDYGVIDRDVRFTGGQFEDASNQTINTLVAKVDQLTEALGDSRAITIEMDGREVARGTYEYTQEYADRKTKMTNRRKGEVY